MSKKEQELLRERLRKLKALRKKGMDPFPATTRRTHVISQALKYFVKLEKQKKKLILVGRVRALRTHGGLTFGNLEDESGVIQFLLKQDEVGKAKFAEFEKYFDIGDFFEAAGTLMKTKRGEKTLLVSEYRMLSKALRALPEKWHGLTDTETRLRKRYLDMIADPAVRELFRRKARFWQSMRGYLEKNGFIEVDTPALEDVTGGADATPFVTHYNALDKDFYLRISLELPLKKIIIGGFEKIYEIGKVFRNEGISSEHLQDYSHCEFYWAYADYEELMKFLESFYKAIVRATTGSLVTKSGGKKINWGKKWQRLDYYQVIEKQSGLKISALKNAAQARRAAEKMGLKLERGWGKGRIIDYIFKKKVRHEIQGPAFLTGHPVEVSPLAKRDAKNPERVQRLQVIAAGTEVGNGWSELNDPLEQRQRFEEQMRLRAAGDPEAQMMDESFVEALEYGMPPTAGFGLSERLFAVLMDKSIRETVIFPPMKEEQK